MLPSATEPMISNVVPGPALRLALAVVTPSATARVGGTVTVGNGTERGRGVAVIVGEAVGVAVAGVTVAGVAVGGGCTGRTVAVGAGFVGLVVGVSTMALGVTGTSVGVTVALLGVTVSRSLTIVGTVAVGIALVDCFVGV